MIDTLHANPAAVRHRIDLPPAGHALWTERWLTADVATRLFEQLHHTLAWQQPAISLFGRRIQIPRMQAWIGDADARYRYSNTTFDPTPWPESLLAVRKALEREHNTQFNSVLANLYRNGDDCMHWHADDEPELGDQPVIASLSLGATRDFRLRHRTGQSAAVTVTLASGDLLTMAGACQTHWQHALPRRKGVTTPRINLTFRNTVN